MPLQATPYRNPDAIFKNTKELSYPSSPSLTTTAGEASKLHSFKSENNNALPFILRKSLHPSSLQTQQKLKSRAPILNRILQASPPEGSRKYQLDQSH